MFNGKVNHMTVIVKGVRDDDYEGRELMMEVIRRNCKMDPRLVSQMVYQIRTYEDGKKKRTDFNVEFEAFDMGGIIRDFELLKKSRCDQAGRKEAVYELSRLLRKARAVEKSATLTFWTRKNQPPL